MFFKVVRAFAFTPYDQDDLFQEVSIQVWHSIPKFRQQSAIITWLYRVSLNTAITWSRKELKHLHGRQSIDTVELLLQETVQHKDERLEWMYEEIAKLNEIDRSLTLLLLDGFSYSEMSTMISETNVGVKIHRIKNHLIRKSEKKYDYHGV